MNTPKLPPPPKPDTHCFDEDTGKDVWSHSPEQMQAYALAAIQAQAQQHPDKVVFCTYPKCQTTGMRCAGPCSLANGYGQGVPERIKQANPQPLTDEQIEAIYTQETGSLIDDSPWALVDFVRAIEAAHNIGEKK